MLIGMNTSYLQGLRNASHRLGLVKQSMDSNAAALVGALLGGGAVASQYPGIRNAVKAYFKGLGQGGAEAVERSAALPAGAVSQARDLATALRSRGLSPEAARIAIIGTGGTGKTTIGRALSQELGMRHAIMDDVGGHLLKGRDLGAYVAKNPIQPGTIAEQTHLLTQVDPDQFDAVVYLRKPIKDVMKQITQRGRGAWQTDLYRYEDIDKALSKGYETLGGQDIKISPSMRVKMRPGASYEADPRLNEQLAALGIDPSGMEREHKVISAALGRKVPVGGVIPYYDPKTFAALGAGGAAGALIGREALGDDEQQ